MNASVAHRSHQQTAQLKHNNCLLYLMVVSIPSMISVDLLNPFKLFNEVSIALNDDIDRDCNLVNPMTSSFCKY